MRSASLRLSLSRASRSPKGRGFFGQGVAGANTKVYERSGLMVTCDIAAHSAFGVASRPPSSAFHAAVRRRAAKQFVGRDTAEGCTAPGFLNRRVRSRARSLRLPGNTRFRAPARSARTDSSVEEQCSRHASRTQRALRCAAGSHAFGCHEARRSRRRRVQFRRAISLRFSRVSSES